MCRQSYTPHHDAPNSEPYSKNKIYPTLTIGLQQRIRKIDKGAVSTVSKEQVVGDSDIRLEVLSKSKNSELTEEDISHKHYCSAMQHVQVMVVH